MTANLFVSAGTGQYMFGNFYAQNFVSVGITPWFSFSFVSGPRPFFDPLFSHYAVINVRQNPMWVSQMRAAYIERVNNVALRPPATFIEQTRIVERNVTINRSVTVIDRNTMVMPLREMAAHPVAGQALKLERVSEAERQQIRRQVAQLHEFREQRASQEREAARRGAGNRPRPMNLPHSPIAARAAAHAAESHAAANDRARAERSAAEHAQAGHPGVPQRGDYQNREGSHPGVPQRPDARRTQTQASHAAQGSAARSNQGRSAQRENSRTSANQRKTSRADEEESQRRHE
jgi:hypothetical protein